MERGTKRFKGVGKPTSAARARLANAKANIQRIPVQLVRSGGRMPSGELKDNTVTNNTALVTFGSTAGQSVLLNGLLMGTSATTRVGRRITIKSIYLRYFACVASGTTLASPIRLMIVMDKQTNAVACGATDVLLADAICSPNNLSNGRRFVTLMDKTIDGIAAAGPQSAHLEFYKKTSLEVQYNTGNAGTVADIQSGSLYLFVWSSGGLGVASPSGQYYSRIRFED